MIRRKVNYILILLISAIYKEINLSVSQHYRKIKKDCSKMMNLIITNSIINQLKFLILIKQLQV